MSHTPFSYPAVEEVELVFFDAMREGWTKNPNLYKPLPLGKKEFEHHGGSFYIVKDSFFTLPRKPYVSGATTIWYKGKPVWRMSYQGQYQEEALPILRNALLYPYENNIFSGGRGPAEYVPKEQGQGWKYKNETQGDFACFHGREELRRYGELKYGGWHEYFGMLLY